MPRRGRSGQKNQFLLTVAARDDEDIEPRCLLQGCFGSKNQSLQIPERFLFLPEDVKSGVGQPG
jgi:hypothetical protein